MNKYRWVVSTPEASAVASVSQLPSIPPAGARLLAARSMTDAAAVQRFLNPAPGDAHDPFLFDHMQEAVAVIDAAARSGAAVLVHGDYDVDGISGAALLYHYFNGIFKTVHRFVPDRRTDGYGVSDRAVDWALEQRVGLFVAVDCGTSDGPKLRRLESAGIPVVVCDHHLLPVEDDVAGILLNPVRPGEHYPFASLCGTSVAFKMVQALHTAGVRGAVEPDSLLDLVALATVADMAALTDENRYFVRAGLEQINRSPRPGIDAIRSTARMSGGPVNSRHLSFVFAPRLNAPGRVSKPKPSLEILCEPARDRALQLAGVLESDNERRRALTSQVEDEAVSTIKGYADLNARGAFVLASDAWDEGVLGIAAARVVEQFGRPAILMSRSHDVLKGSGRSVPGVDLKHELDQFHDRLLRYGGHAGAVGLTMAPDQLSGFADDFSRHLRGIIHPDNGLPLRVDVEIELAECTLELLDFLGSCEPFGSGNPQPVWMLRDLEVTRETTWVGDGHLRLAVMDGSGARATAIAFGWDRKETPEDLHGRTIDLAVTLRKHTYMGTTSVELRVVDVRASQG
ncbi:MAG TPA: single-stranded-DNA-specific exonuclease RecJ [Candidatus Krumholzibacteria bacterium]|nr:single-stranded-DNA-specific exonuclease RecJ [Candidatus Krumholzibacteria bacterium]